MNKKIEFSYEGKEYVLEYNREAIAFIERQGFSVNELASKPMLMLPLAFSGLFFKNHKSITQKEIDKIYDKFNDKGKLITTLSEMLTETYNSLQADPEEKEGNIDWKIV